MKASGAAEEAPEGSLFKLDGQTKTPLKAGSVISKDDFDKLHWDATKGDGDHTIEFVPVKANESEITGAKPQTFTVHEAAAEVTPPPQQPPQGEAEPKIGVYGDAAKIDLTHDQAPYKIGAAVFKGNEEAKAPDAVKIIDIARRNYEVEDENAQHGWVSLSGQALGTGLNEQNHIDYNKKLDSNQPLLKKEDFDKAMWDAAFDNGSGDYRITFKPVTAEGKDIDGAPVRTINIHEAAENPDYSTPPAAQHVATLNGNVHIKPSVFEGNAPSKAPMYIRLTHVEETAGGDGNHTVLYIKGEGDNNVVPFTPADINKEGGVTLTAAQFGQLHWDAANNEGGSFKFKPLGGDMKDIAESVEQTVTVTEAKAEQPPAEVAKVGTYDDTTKSVPVATHDAQDTPIASKFFAGIDGKTAPEFVKINSIKLGDADVAAEKNGLYKQLTDNGDKVTVNANDVLTKAEFDKLHWDASKGDDGTHTIEFTPVKNDAGDALEMATKHSFTVVEPDAIAPPAPPAAESQSLESVTLFNQPPMLKSVDFHPVISDNLELQELHHQFTPLV